MENFWFSAQCARLSETDDIVLLIFTGNSFPGCVLRVFLLFVVCVVARLMREISCHMFTRGQDVSEKLQHVSITTTNYHQQQISYSASHFSLQQQYCSNAAIFCRQTNARCQVKTRPRCCNAWHMMPDTHTQVSTMCWSHTTGKLFIVSLWSENDSQRWQWMAVTDQWPGAGETATRTPSYHGSWYSCLQALDCCCCCFVSDTKIFINNIQSVMSYHQSFAIKSIYIESSLDNYLFQFLQIFGQFLTWKRFIILFYHYLINTG